LKNGVHGGTRNEHYDADSWLAGVSKDESFHEATGAVQNDREKDGKRKTHGCIFNFVVSAIRNLTDSRVRSAGHFEVTCNEHTLVAARPD